MEGVARIARLTCRLAAALLLLALARPLLGVSLATVRYGAEHGLASDNVRAILVDSRGFVWIGTNEGLSRFDGASLETFGVEDGLPSAVVRAICEGGDGSVWVGTNRGLARLTVAETPGAPVADASVEGLPAGARVEALAVRDAGSLWAVVDDAIWRVTVDRGRARAAKEAWADGIRSIVVIAPGVDGDLWIGTEGDGVVRRRIDGRVEQHAVMPYAGVDGVSGLRVMGDGTVWVGTLAGYFVFRPDDGERTGNLAERAGERVYRPGQAWSPPVAAGEVVRLVRTDPDRLDLRCLTPVAAPDGTVWAAAPDGLFRSRDGRWTLLGPESGLEFDELTATAVDSLGNVWLGTLNSGVIVVRQRGLVSYTMRDGLVSNRIQQVLESPAGETLVVSVWQLHHVDGDLVRSIPLGPRSLRYQGWGWAQVVAFDSGGDAWVAGGEGLFRYPGVRRFDDFAASRPRLYTTEDGLGSNETFRVWADDGGEVWVGTFGEAVLARYDREKDAFVSFPSGDGLPKQAPTAFARDRSGALWIGFYEGGLSRFDGERFRYFDESDGVPSGFVHALEVDSAGRLWVATGPGGVCVADRPDEDPFRCRSISLSGSHATDAARALVEDGEGAMWIGTTRGLSRVDPDTDAVQHYTRGDGLASNIVTCAFRGRDDSLWFGTVGGLSQREGDLSRPAASGRTLLTSVRVNGQLLRRYPLGIAGASLSPLGPETRTVEVGLASPIAHLAGPAAFAWRLEGLDDGWTTSERGAARFERLPYRRYRLVAKVVPEGGGNVPEAVLAFRIDAPVWRRWWFIGCVAALLGTLLWLWYRTHVRHLVAVEQMRTRIATDLHDDLGSTLSRISILSEVAKMQVDGASPAARILGDIGENARSLVGALGDSIWSIDPRVDDLKSLVARARHHAVEMFEGAGVRSRFDVAEGLEHVHLDPVQRRQIFLILKEALNNAAKHSKATQVVVSIQLMGSRLLVEIVDDGCGFGTGDVGPREHGTGGRGVGSMRARAESLGGRLEIVSTPGEGTTLVLEVPTAR
jgi:ligand-binding sensor domain-containing protein/signal transduction histidine kinase